MAHAFVRSGPTSARRPRCGVDPRVLNFMDDQAIVDNSFLSDSGCSSRSGDTFEHSSDDSMSP